MAPCDFFSKTQIGTERDEDLMASSRFKNNSKLRLQSSKQRFQQRGRWDRCTKSQGNYFKGDNMGYQVNTVIKGKDVPVLN